jgi:tRNA threonylcarbamoyladenosine biosynthesis protein TsaE
LTPGGAVTTSGAAETEALGAKLAGGLQPGDVVLVEGELGAGKTTFVRGACSALGVSARVTSPTFAIGHRYPGAVPVAHLDLYRLASLDGEEEDLLADYLGADTVTFVEWPRDAESALTGGARIAARVRIEHAGADVRAITIERSSGR